MYWSVSQYALNGEEQLNLQRSFFTSIDSNVLSKGLSSFKPLNPSITRLLAVNQEICLNFNSKYEVRGISKDFDKSIHEKCVYEIKIK